MMSAKSPQLKPRRWPLIIAVVAAVLAVAVVVALMLGLRGSPTPPTTPTPTSDTQSPAPTGNGVDACLGGPELTADALFTAQREAPHTPEGAVSYGSAFARYVLQIPEPADIGQAASWNGLSATWWSDWHEAAETWSGPNPLHSTTVGGSYKVQSYTEGEAVVVIELPWLVDGAITSRTFVPTLTLQWAAAGNWTVVGVNNSSADDPAALTDATEFTEGC